MTVGRSCMAFSLAMLAMGLASCDQDATFGPDLSPQPAISDGAHDGNQHFYFLPPMVANPGPFSSPFDASLEPLVRVCAWSAGACVGAPVAEYTTTSGSGSEVVRVVPDDEHYIVNWHTDEFALQPAPAVYRVQVWARGSELGFADIQFGSTGGEVRNLTTDETIGLLDGRTLPIKFRIEGFKVGAGGGTIVALGGDVVLIVEAGALTKDVDLTVFPTTAPASVGLVEGSIFDLGPDGITFDPPSTLKLRYDDAVLGGVAEANLTLLTKKDGLWEQLPGAVVDASANTVTAAIDGFSQKATGEVVEKVVYTEEAKDPVKAGDTKQLKAETHGASGKVLSDRKITYKSSDPAIAEVDATGKVTAKRPGKVTITAESGGKTTTTVVVVDGPDLVVSSVGPITVTATDLTVTYTLANIGIDALDLPSNSVWDVAVFVSSDPVFDAGDVQIGGLYTSWTYPLVAGWSQSVTITRPFDTSGLDGAYIIVVADAFPGQGPNYYPGVEERDEDNNWAASAVIVLPPSEP